MRSAIIKASAFTLIELMMVIAILGILAAVAIPAYREYVYNTKLAEGYVGVEAINKAQSTFYIDHKYFLTLLTELNGFNGATSGGGKHAISDLDSAWQYLGTPLPQGTETYFHFMTNASYWDASGTQQTDLVDPLSGAPINLGNDDGVSDKSCANTVSSAALGITSAANRRTTITSGAAALKAHASQTDNLNCTYIIQTLIADGTEVQRSAMITMRE